MRKIILFSAVILSFIYVSFIASVAAAVDEDEYFDYSDEIKEIGDIIEHVPSGIVAIDPTKAGGVVVSPFAIQIQHVGFEYANYDDLIFVPDDGVPSMVLVFGKGSVVSTLYLDDDAKKLLESNNKNDVEIVGMVSLIVSKSDLRKAEETVSGVYAVDVKDTGGEHNIKNALDGELVTGSKIVYPQIVGSDTPVKGARVIIKESKDISFFEIRSINDFMLWLNLKFSMNLNNDEKKIFRDGIFATLEKTVEDNTAGAPAMKKMAAQGLSEDTCVAVG